jgi:hypothetical protein
MGTPGAEGTMAWGLRAVLDVLAGADQLGDATGTAKPDPLDVIKRQ